MFFLILDTPYTNNGMNQEINKLINSLKEVAVELLVLRAAGGSRFVDSPSRCAGCALFCSSMQAKQRVSKRGFCPDFLFQTDNIFPSACKKTRHTGFLSRLDFKS